MRTSSLFTALLIMLCAATLQAKKPDYVAIAYVFQDNELPIETEHITHINYAFGHVTDTYDGVRLNSDERLREIVALKEKDRDLKVLVSIGGWGSGRFSEMAANDNYRKSFAKDCKRLVDEFDLDGIDIDWEYPTSGAGGISYTINDTENFTKLMRDLRKAIGSRKLLTIAVAATGVGIDYKAIEPYMDYINLMTYDVSDPPYHHAALFSSSQTITITCQQSVDLHLAAGVPADKLVLGVPFYGHWDDNEGKYQRYAQLKQNPKYIECWDNDAKVPFFATVAEGKMVYSFENVRSIEYKMEYVKKRNLAGAMYWEYSSDDAQGTFRKTIYNCLNNDK